MASVFISHTHSDQPLADALSELMRELFADKVQVNYSSRKELDGGIAPGDDWFRWIVEQVRVADAALILLTPASVQKPWVIWEAGAVAGAAFATAAEEMRVFPLTFGIRSSEVPTPFARTQLVAGADDAEVGKLVDDLFGRFGRDFTPKEMKRFGAEQDGAVRRYLEKVRLDSHPEFRACSPDTQRCCPEGVRSHRHTSAPRAYSAFSRSPIFQT